MNRVSNNTGNKRSLANDTVNDEVIAKLLEESYLERAVERAQLHEEEEEASRAVLAVLASSELSDDAIAAEQHCRIQRACSVLPSKRCNPGPVVNRPTASEADIAHDRLVERLKFYGLEELEVKGDGSCQFRAIADQLYRNQELHGEVRRQAVEELRSNPVRLRRHLVLRKAWELYSPYVGNAREFEAYCAKMAHGGEWGDHITLQAVANAFSVDINMVTSYHFNGVIEVTARSPERASRACWLSFWAEVHYNSIYPAGEKPEPGAAQQGGGLLRKALNAGGNALAGRKAPSGPADVFSPKAGRL